MSRVEKIVGEVQAARTGFQAAQDRAVAADHQAEEVGKRAQEAGFLGIAAGMSGVRTGIADIRKQLAAVGGSLGEAGTAVAAAPKEAAPEQTIAALTPAQQKIDNARQGVSGAITKVEETKQMVHRALQGGQPGPLVAALDAVKQVLLQVHQRCGVAKQEVDAVITTARQMGGSGN
jgi:hypothetical protein